MEKKQKARLFVTQESITAQEIKDIRKKLHLTQGEFAQLIGCSKPTVERWERSEDGISGLICFIVKMLEKYPEYVSTILSEFLESRCFPRSRDKMKLVLQDLELPFYDPFLIIEKKRVETIIYEQMRRYSYLFS